MQNAIEVVEVQVAKAGARLARWMDLIVNELQVASESEVAREDL